ncbi:hypothetical protein V8C34DRAFT_73623 [Trichoderma compactum]
MTSRWGLKGLGFAVVRTAAQAGRQSGEAAAESPTAKRIYSKETKRAAERAAKSSRSVAQRCLWQDLRARRQPELWRLCGATCWVSGGFRALC